MNIIREAMAGSLESSDILVRVSPGKKGIQIELTSIVMAQFGEAIRREITGALETLGVSDIQVIADDKGALDFVIRARVQAAVGRASGLADADTFILARGA